MAQSNSSTSTGIGFSGALLITFIVLKLCKVIDWSWWWVLSPFWIPVGIVLILLLVFLLIKTMADSKGERTMKRQRSKWQQRMDEMQNRKNY